MTTINLSTTNINDYTVEDLKTLKAAALQHANDAAVAYMDTHGEQWYCGFAWVNIYGVKGNTKIGRRLKLAGVQQSWDKSFQVWNPGSHGGQSMDVKEAGARAYADVLTAYGFTAYPGSRAD